MKKILVACLVTFTLTTIASAEKIKIYDSKGLYRGHINTDSGRIYNEKNIYKGRVSKSNKIYDAKSRFRGTFVPEKDSIDKKWGFTDED